MPIERYAWLLSKAIAHAANSSRASPPSFIFRPPSLPTLLCLLPRCFICVQVSEEEAKKKAETLKVSGRSTTKAAQPERGETNANHCPFFRLATSVLLFSPRLSVAHTHTHLIAARSHKRPVAYLCTLPQENCCLSLHAPTRDMLLTSTVALVCYSGPGFLRRVERKAAVEC